MNRPNYTPGPWFSCPGNAKRHFKIECNGSDNDLEPVATLTGPDREANAQGIAAFHDWRESLEKLNTWLIAPDTSKATLQEMHALTKAALKKAGYIF